MSRGVSGIWVFIGIPVMIGLLGAMGPLGILILGIILAIWMSTPAPPDDWSDRGRP